jgi:hypothetical protein
MNTYKELVYMVLDELKNFSDDATYTEDHVIFLLNKWRTFLLKQRYADVKKQIPESNYQSICLDLIEVPAISGEPCEGGSFLRSTKKIPNLMTIGNPQAYPVNYYLGNITFISRERMRYVGYNKYLKNIIYASIGPDNYLYLKASNPQFLYLEKLRLNAIFEDTDEASELECDSDESTSCDTLDKDFPIESGLVPQLIESVVKELSGALYKPADPENNANDDLSSIQTFIRSNIKSPLLKQLES